MTGTRARLKYGRTQHCVDSDWELGGGKFARNKSDINNIFCTAHTALLSPCCLDTIAVNNLTQSYDGIENGHLSVYTLALACFKYQPGVFNVRRRECNWCLWLPNSSKLLLVTLDSMIGCYGPGV